MMVLQPRPCLTESLPAVVWSELYYQAAVIVSQCRLELPGSIEGGSDKACVFLTSKKERIASAIRGGKRQLVFAIGNFADRLLRHPGRFRDSRAGQRLIRTDGDEYQISLFHYVNLHAGWSKNGLAGVTGVA